MECACRVQGDVVLDICGLHMRMIRDASAKAVAAAVAAEREACATVIDRAADDLRARCGPSIGQLYGIEPEDVRRLRILASEIRARATT